MKIMLASVMAMFLFAGAASAQTSNSNANSNANSDSNSVSRAGANSDQGQSQGQTAANANTQATQLNFAASKIPTESTLKTNSNVPLAAAVSFSSDYCGGTVSGGISGFGVSLGAGGPKMDEHCMSLRRAEKFGTAAANAYNAGMKDMAVKLISMEVWELCSAEVTKDGHESNTLAACRQLALVGAENLTPATMPPQIPANQTPAIEPTAQTKGAVYIRDSSGNEVPADPRKHNP